MGVFTLLLSVMGLSLFASLAAADRALVDSQRQLAALDAQNAALVASRHLRDNADRLTEFFDPLLGGARAERIRPPAGFERVWVLDSSTRIRFGPAASAADSGALLAIVGMMVDSASPVLRVHDDRGPRVLLAVPLTHRGASLGVAVGQVPMQSILRAVSGDAAGGSWVAIRTATQTVASVGTRGRDQGPPAAARIPVAGDTLYLAVARSARGRDVRRVLWTLGVVALVVLLAGLARERRQALSLGARTAELERLYQEVARSNRMKSEFLANVSHELRTPLNAIVGFVEMLREGVYGEMTPRQALPVDRIAASANHLRQLVDRLLDIAKIAAGRLEVHLEPVVLRPFVLNIASEMESLVTEQGLSLSISIPTNLPRISSDQTHLRQILINLIGNAVKYTATGGIHVRATRIAGDGTAADELTQAIGTPPDSSKEWVALMVTDTGVGIASADLERIFDEFEQVNAGARTDSARRGTGLGLAISRRLARHLGGDISVVSTPGAGSTFTVWLPLDAEPGGVQPSPEPRGRMPA